MADVALNWCSLLLLLAIALKSAVSSDKLSNLQDRLNLFDYITEGNVSVLLHRVEAKDLKCIDDVTVHMNESNRKLANLEDTISALTSVIPKQNDFESKFNVFATRVTSNVSAILHLVEEKESQCDEYAKMHMNETNRKLANLEDKIESKFNVSAILHRLEENESKYDDYAKMHMNETNRKLANLEDKIDTRLTDLESKLNAMAATITNFVGNIEGRLLQPLSSCADAFTRCLFNRGSGVYDIEPIANSLPFKVYCMADPKGGEPWTVVQRRVDGTVDFYRNWTEYQRGFGDLEGNLWIGLDKLHWLTTKAKPQELWVMLTDHDGVSKHAFYDRFTIGNETEKYPLKDLGNYSGDAGDSLKYHKSSKFSTYDNDNDAGGANCAKSFNSAWWFKDCFFSHLNGVYNNLHWFTFRLTSHKYAHMAIRPARK